MPAYERGASTARDAWADVARAWRHRDSGPIRSLMEVVLGTEPLEVWRDLSQAVFEERKPERLKKALRDRGRDPADLDDDEPETWRTYAETAAQSLENAVDMLPPGCHPPALALLATFVYFEILCFWERSDEYDRFRGVISTLEALHQRIEANGSATGRCGQIVTAARDLASSLRAQFEVEMALGCSCPVLFGKAAPAAAQRLGQVVDDLRRFDGLADAGGSASACDRLPGGCETTLLALGEILLEDAEHTHGYFALLEEHVGPAARAFVGNLVQRGDDNAVVERIKLAIAEAAAYETSREGRAGVFSTEARAHRATLVAMHDRLVAREPSLRVTDGEIVLLYPFSLPVSSSGDGIVRRLMTSGRLGPTGLVLAGAAAHLDDVPRSGIWIRSGTDEMLDNALRLVFDQHVLMLETTSGLRYQNLDIEIRLNGLGNHFVRITVSTGTDTDLTKVPEDARPPSRAWTPHDVDQWVRRIGYDFGQERIWFEPRHPTTDEEPQEHGYFTDLVKKIVHDLMLAALETGETSQGALDADDLQVKHILQSTSVHARVMAVVTGLESVMSDGQTKLVTDPRLIPGLIGASTLLTGQRRYPTGLEEWVRAQVPPLENLLGDDGLAGELVVHNENLTLVFATFTPNWQLITYRELVEFADSLAGSYSTWARRLSGTAHRASRELPRAPTEEQMDGLLKRSIELVTRQSQVRALLGHVRSRELLYNSRNRRFLDRLMVSGRLTVLEDEVDAALLTLHTHQEWVAALLESGVEQRERREEDARREREDERRQRERREEDARREREDERRQREFVFNGVIGLIALLGFFEAFSWLNGERQWTGTSSAFWVELVFTIVVLFVGAGLLLRMYYKNAAKGRTDEPVRWWRRGRRAAATRRDRSSDVPPPPDDP